LTLTCLYAIGQGTRPSRQRRADGPHTGRTPGECGNLLAADQATVEVGTSTYSATVTELTGDERDRVYAEQDRRMPGFAEYAEKTAGIRTIPVLRLTAR
jgi:hypothetical protein